MQAREAPESVFVMTIGSQSPQVREKAWGSLREAPAAPGPQYRAVGGGSSLAMIALVR